MSVRACSNCGHPLSEDARFCPNCGQDVTQPAGTVIVATEPAEPLDPDEQPVPWRAIEGLAIFIIAVIITVIITIPLTLVLRPVSNCGSLGGDATTTCLNHRDLLMALLIGGNELALLATVVFWVKVVHKRNLRALWFRNFSLANVLTGVGVGVAGEFVAIIIAAIMTSIIQNVTNRPVTQPKQISLQTNPSALVLTIVGLSVIVFAPLAEEAFFRGFVFRGLLRWARPGWAIVLSAAIFGIAHLIPLIMVPIFGLGVLLAAIVRSRKSIVPSICAHMTFNAIGFAVQFVHINR